MATAILRYSVREFRRQHRDCEQVSASLTQTSQSSVYSSIVFKAHTTDTVIKMVVTLLPSMQTGKNMAVVFTSVNKPAKSLTTTQSSMTLVQFTHNHDFKVFHT